MSHYLNQAPGRTTTGRFRTLACTISLFLSAALGADAAFIELTGDRKVEGASVRRDSDGNYVIQTPNGTRTYQADQVVRAEAARPEEYDRAVGLAQNRQFEQAVPLLQAIAARYRGLGWDDRANLVLAKIHTAERDYASAVPVFEALAEDVRSRPDVEPAYWRALLETDSFERLEPLLNHAIRAAPRDVAAQAQLLRGDVKMRRKQVEPAALDYLRTVVLFDAVRSVQPEALYKAGKALQAMRHEKANDMFDRLAQQYPESKYAAMPRSE